MKKLIIFSILAIHVFAEDCTEKKPIRLVKGLKMKCVKGQWLPVQRRGGPAGPPCEDDASLSAQGTCSADRGHCSQFTEKGAQMDKDCPGTCDSCDGCRCQDNSQWHKFCPFWAQYCDSPGVLGNWMSQNCRKSCNKCKCKCCSYQGKKHRLNDHITLPEKCGELVCEEGLVAEESPLLAGAAHHNVSHPEELTLVFRSLFPGSECCLLPSGGQDRNNREKMVQEGWSGQLSRSGNKLQATCCHGILCVPLKEIKPEQSQASASTETMITATTTSTSRTTTTTATTTTATTTTTTSATTTTTTTTTTTKTITTEAPSCTDGWERYGSSCFRVFSNQVTWSQAQAACQTENGNLASIPDSTTNNGVTNLFQAIPPMWIGLSRPTRGSAWAWVDKSPLNYEAWGQGSPSGDGDCAEIWNDGWNDLDCNALKRAYVCEKAGQYVEVEEITASSTYGSQAHYGPHFAIDGVLSNENKFLLITNSEPYSWAQLKLSQPQMVAGVELFNRPDCCGDRLRNLEIRAGLDPVPEGTTGDVLLTQNARVGYFPGPGADNGTHKIMFATPKRVQFITLQLTDRNYLQLNEVKVIADGN